MKKVLIMTPDIEGPVRNGGIGTAFTALAVMLKKSVTELFGSKTINSAKLAQQRESLNFTSKQWLNNW